jgi:hypothetical protein
MITLALQQPLYPTPGTLDPGVEDRRDQRPKGKIGGSKHEKQGGYQY